MSANPVSIDLPTRAHPLLVILTLTPLALTIAVLAMVVFEDVPWPLILLLMVVVGCSLVLSHTAGQYLLGGALIADENGITVKRLLGETVYPWNTVEDIKVTPATGTFGDDPFLETAKRIGAGLFLRNPERDREHEFDADVVLCSGSADETSLMMQIVQKANRQRELSERPALRAPVRRRQANQRQEFRAKPQARNVVADFRKQSNAGKTGD